MYSSKKPTQRQWEIFNFLRKIQNRQGVAPTYREIADHFGFKSPKAAMDHVRALEKKGYLRCHGGRSRGIELTSSERKSFANSVPILGDIPAGSPEKRAEDEHGNLNVDLSILDIPSGHRLFALAVSGESMQGRGIHDGDCVIADADAQPREGDVVIAMIDGENTLKTLARQNGSYYLKAENPIYIDWYPLEEMVVQGVAKAIIRRL